MDLKLAGATALVTGASRGIGRAVAQTLAREGCDVAINARGAEPLDKLADELRRTTSRNVVACPGDMGGDDAARVVRDAIAALGHLDILVTCAGSVPGGAITDISDEDWQAGLGLKFLGYVRCLREVLPHMEARGSGAVTLVVGNAGLKPSPWELAAGVANAADLNLAASLADQYASRGVRINTVNPGPVDTSRWPGSIEGFAQDKGISEERSREVLLGTLPLGRLCTADEVAPMVAFLSSPMASYTTGTHVVIDGGQRKAMLEL